MSYYVDNQGRIRKNFAPTRTIPVFADIDNHLDDRSENPVQNRVVTKEINRIKEILGEVVIEAEELTFTYLNKSTLPHSVEDKKIVFNAGMDLKEIKGRSYVVNQLLQTTHFENKSVDDLLGTFTLKANHKYIFIQNYSRQSESTSDTDYQVYFYGDNIVSQYNINIRGNFIYTAPNGDNVTLRLSVYSQFTIPITFNIYVVDLTQWFGSNDAIPSDLLSNPNLFLSKYYFDTLGYEEGIIRNTEPTRITTRGFNIWDEQWEIGSIDRNTGETTSGDKLISTNYIKIKGGATYCMKHKAGAFTLIYGYNANKTFYGTYDVISTHDSYNTFTLPNEIEYIRFTSEVETYNNDICINISNASLNGTYKPYEEHHYPISVPFLRSAGNVQDTDKKVNIGIAYIGDLDWSEWGSTEEITQYYTGGLDALAKENSKTLCTLYIDSPSMVANSIYISSGNGRTYVRTEKNKYASPQAFKEAMSGIAFYYELETPTDQIAITLPEDIKIQEGGTIELGFYESEMTPCDMTFEIAVSRLEE